MLSIDSLKRTGLTEREAEVVILSVRGCTTKEVAIELGIAVKTAETHVHNILRKAGASTKTQAVAHYLTAVYQAHVAAAVSDHFADQIQPS